VGQGVLDVSGGEGHGPGGAGEPAPEVLLDPEKLVVQAPRLPGVAAHDGEEAEAADGLDRADDAERPLRVFPQLHAVASLPLVSRHRDLAIRDNLIILDRDNTAALSTVTASGGAWAGVDFTGNRVVFFDHARGQYAYQLHEEGVLGRVSTGRLRRTR